jgi:hypothetical protein
MIEHEHAEGGQGKFRDGPLAAELDALSKEGDHIKESAEAQLLSSGLTTTEEVELVLLKEGLKPATEVYIYAPIYLTDPGSKILTWSTPSLYVSCCA